MCHLLHGTLGLLPPLTPASGSRPPGDLSDAGVFPENQDCFYLLPPLSSGQSCRPIGRFGGHILSFKEEPGQLAPRLPQAASTAQVFGASPERSRRRRCAESSRRGQPAKGRPPWNAQTNVAPMDSPKRPAPLSARRQPLIGAKAPLPSLDRKVEAREVPDSPRRAPAAQVGKGLAGRRGGPSAPSQPAPESEAVPPLPPEPARQSPRPSQGWRQAMREERRRIAESMALEAAGRRDALFPVQRRRRQSARKHGDAEGAGKGDALAQTRDNLSNGKREEDLHNVFRKLRMDNELHRDDIPQALELARFPKPKPLWIEQAYKKFSRYSTLSQEEFVSFVRDYETLQREAYAKEFALMDANGNGAVEADELKDFLQKFGLDPLQHVLDEAILEVDTDDNGSLEFNEFEKVFELVQMREGFARSDHERFMDAFARFDVQGLGRIAGSKFATLLAWLGYAWTPENAWKVVKEVDVDNCGNLNCSEFLSCMRIVRDRELENIKLAMLCRGAEVGQSHAKELEEVFRIVGYVTDVDVLDECAQEAGLSNREEESLDLSDFWKVLSLYRMREGFSSADEEEIHTVFDRCDKDRKGVIPASILGKALRYLGLPVPWEVRQDLLGKVDLADTGLLNYFDFRKLARMCHDKLVWNIKRVFAARDVSNSGTVPRDIVDEMLDSLKIVDDQDRSSREILLGFIPRDQVTYAEFAFVANCLSKAAMLACRDNGGFRTSELRELKSMFRRCDRDQSGALQASELVSVIDGLFPVFARDLHHRPELERTLQEIDENGNGSLDFEEFLRLIIKVREVQDNFRYKKEVWAIAKSGFSKDEVREFRDLFIASDDGDGELSLDEAKDMIGTVVPLGDKNMQAFMQIFNDVAPCQHGVDGSDDKVDFPEFLIMMRRMMDHNFGRILDISRRIARVAAAKITPPTQPFPLHSAPAVEPAPGD